MFNIRAEDRYPQGYLTSHLLLMISQKVKVRENRYLFPTNWADRKVVAISVPRRLPAPDRLATPDRLRSSSGKPVSVQELWALVIRLQHRLMGVWVHESISHW